MPEAIQAPQVQGEVPSQPRTTPGAPEAPQVQPQGEADGKQGEQAHEQGKPEGTSTPEAPNTEESEREAELPEWAQKERASLRKEAARYRSERNELRDQVEAMQKQLASAKTQEDVDAAIAEWRAKVEQFEAKQQRDSDVQAALDGAQLDAKWGKYLQGNTAEELKACAAELASELSTTGAVLSGGLNPSDEGDDQDVKKTLRRLRPASIL